MDNITTYIRWYSNFDFLQLPFSVVDNLVLCNLAYSKYDLKDNKSCLLKDCLVINEAISGSFQNEARRSKRYGNIEVSRIKEQLSEDCDNPVQFFALTFTYLPNKHFVAFRGTDSTLAGWKEDLMMGYQGIQAQTLALDYLENLITSFELPDHTFLVGGHSKGANLALYACAYLKQELMNKIEHIYLNDGPGLNPSICDISKVEPIKTKTTVIQPEFSIFGKIYEYDFPDTRIVKSTQQGLLQHGIGTWIVENGDLIYSKHNADTSVWVSQVIDTWINNESEENRRLFTDELFRTLTSTGAKTRQEIKLEGLNEIKNYWKAISRADKKAKIVAGKLPLSAIFGNFFNEINAGHIFKAVHESITIQGIICTLIGLFMMLLPRRFFDTAFVIALFSIVIIQIVNMINMLYRHRRHLRHLIPQVVLCSASFALFTILIVKESALFIIESGTIGFILLVWSFRNWIHTKESKISSFEYYKNLIETVFTLLYGIFILVAPSSTVKPFTFWLGTYMFLDGTVTAITGQS